MIAFDFADELKESCKHCATIARASLNTFVERRLVPNVDSPTATVSFIEIDGRCYALTANHVIQQFQNMAAKEDCDPEGYFLPAQPGVGMSPYFVQPSAPLLGHRPDIALRQVKPELIARIGKRPFSVRASPEPMFPVAYALAVGFPTASKGERDVPGGTQVELACAWAVAEGVSARDSDQIQFFSEVHDAQTVSSLSGMSGGPVFWSSGAEHGLLGFVKEAMDVAPKEGESSLFSGPRVNFICERASFQTIKQWTEEADQKYPQIVEEINERTRQRQSAKLE
jgi:hypothetical protein